MKQPILTVVRNEAESSAKILLYGVIGNYWSDDPLTATQFVRLLTSLEKNYSTINVHIHSPGGDVWEGLAICNAIKASKKTINTHNDGIAMSMGACILACGKNRYAAKGSITMIHNASTISWGTAETLRQDADMLDTTDEVLAEYFADAMGQTLEQIQATYFDNKDHFLSAKEAEKLGLFIITDNDAEDVPENVQNMPMHQVAALYKGNIKTPQNNNLDMSLFKNPFKGTSALAKVAAKDITDEHIQTVQNEFEANEIEGLTVVRTTDLQAIDQAAEKVPVLTQQVTDLGAQVTAEKKKVTDLEAKVAALSKELGKPAEEAVEPVTDKTDTTPKEVKKDVKDEFHTSVDDEAKKYFS